jgi:hypothetical protein
VHRRLLRSGDREWVVLDGTLMVLPVATVAAEGVMAPSSGTPHRVTLATSRFLATRPARSISRWRYASSRCQVSLLTSDTSPGRSRRRYHAANMSRPRTSGVGAAEILDRSRLEQLCELRKNQSICSPRSPTGRVIGITVPGDASTPPSPAHVLGIPGRRGLPVCRPGIDLPHAFGLPSRAAQPATCWPAGASDRCFGARASSGRRQVAKPIHSGRDVGLPGPAAEATPIQAATPNRRCQTVPTPLRYLVTGEPRRGRTRVEGARLWRGG